MNILISSAGRRNYLVNWFREAGALSAEEVKVIAADGDPYAPALADADEAVILPPISSPDYTRALTDVCSKYEVSLLLSVHDYDIATISARVAEGLISSGVSVAVPPKATLDVVSDKLATAEVLQLANIHVPRTFLATDLDADALTDQVVVKHRYGSGSSGVLVVPVEMLEHAVQISSLSASDAYGSRPEVLDLSLVVVQEKVQGDEFGIDVVCDLNGDFQGVLARKKLRMRAGETDRAVTVDAEPFESLARALASSIELRGNTDLDIIVTPEGEQHIIDINPRFGGGYPFMHMAGANVPACYLAWAMDGDLDPTWLQYETGVVSSKYGSIHRSGVK